MSEVLTKIMPPNTPFGLVVHAIASVAKAVGMMCGVTDEKEKVEDIGDRALQAEEKGITIQSCDNDFNKYMEKLRSFELDPEKSKASSLNDKMLSGSMVLEKGIQIANPKLETVGLWALAAFAPQIMTKDRIDAWAKVSESTGISLASIAKVFLGDKLNNVENNSVIKNANEKFGQKALFAAEKTLTPEKSDNEIYERINSMQNEIDAAINKKNR